MAKLVWRGAMAAFACLFLLSDPALAARSRPSAQPLEGGLLDEVNFARTQPRDYARVLLDEADSPRSQSSSFAWENPRDLDEAVDFLMRQRPLPPLKANGRLGDAALSYAVMQGRQGGFGHQTAGLSLSQRMQERGLFAAMMAEDISYGYRTPRDVVRQLIVDSGVPSRGHRNNLFGAYQSVGIGCGPHRIYGAMCVLDFAGGVSQR
jgi:uncharacterized protein YkwD